MDTRIRGFLQLHADFDFTIYYDEGYISFSRKVQTRTGEETVTGIKISRGEENLFIWCFFLAIVQLVKDEALTYEWVNQNNQTTTSDFPRYLHLAVPHMNTFN